MVEGKAEGQNGGDDENDEGDVVQCLPDELKE